MRPPALRLIRMFAMLTYALASLAAGRASAATPADPGRLFYTPAQRAQLEHARTHKLTQRARAPGTQDSGPAPQRYDGVVTRSDGRATHWVDGSPQPNAAGVPGLKPGQIRADGKVYEPYQVLRPTPPAPAASTVKEPAP